MEVNSVNSGSSAYASASRQASESRQAADAMKVQQQTERPKEKLEERAETKAEAPRPVVNAQGQKTGSNINITA